MDLSRFKFFEESKMVRSLSSQTGRTYQLLADDNLPNLQPLGAPVAGDGETIEFVDPLGTRRFYRILVSIQ